ncbi:MAG TPA: DUF2231 domain-containing protein [Streptosporangiales bacterium]
MYEAKHPVSAMAGPYGHPLHPALVAVPVGAWVTSLVFDVASHFVADPGFLVRGSTWLVAIGIIGALAAACVGFLDLFAIPSGTRALRVALTHMSLNLGVVVGYGVDLWWRVSSPVTGGGVPLGRLILAAACLGTLTVSAYLGGKLAYRYGVRVADETTQAEGFDSGNVRHVKG